MSETIYNKKLLDAVRKSPFFIEEIAPLARIPEPVLYRILIGMTNPDQITRERLAIVLNEPLNKLFPEGE